MTKLSQKTFVKRVKQVNPDIKILGIYRTFDSRIIVKCKKCGRIWDPLAGNLLQGHGCPVCRKAGQISQAEFVKKLESKRKDVILVGPYVKATQKTDFKFLSCGHTCSVTPSKILSGNGCPKCAQAKKGATQRYTLEKVKQIAYGLNPKLTVVEGETYQNSLTPIKFHCSECGKDFSRSFKVLKRSSDCPICHRTNTSFFEQFIYHAFILACGEENVLSRDRKAVGEELDIFIPSLKFAVEPGSWSFHSKLVERDKLKQKICAGKNILLVTVYDHYKEEEAPFNNCITYKEGLTAKKASVQTLKRLVETLFKMSGVRRVFSQADWDLIVKRARQGTKRMTTGEFKKELATLNPNLEFIDEYDLANSLKRFRCKRCNYEWEVAPTTVRMGVGCPRCAGRLNVEDFVERLSRINPNIKLADKNSFVNTTKPALFRCKKCGYRWKTQPRRLINAKHKAGCPKCSHHRSLTHEEFIARVSKISQDIEVIGIYQSSSQPIKVKCSGCGKVWWAKPNNLLQGKGCKNCKARAAWKKRLRHVECIDTGEIFLGLHEAALRYNVSPSAIVNCCKGKTKHAAGKCWRYVDS